MIDYIVYEYLEHELTLSFDKMKNLPEDILLELQNWQVEYADKVIIAYDNNVLVGFFRYDLGDTRPWLYAAGTYIIPSYRKKNIASNLWHKAIELEKPNKILAHIASDGGLKLIEKIKKDFPKMLFDYSLDKKVFAA